MANLRIVSKNQVTAVGGSSTAAACNDYKSQFQSGSSFTVSTSSLSGNIAIVAVLAEDVAAVTMTYSSSSSSETTSSDINTTPVVGYGGVKYIAIYTTASGATSFNISFNKTVKVSRFIIGNYWSPTHNMGFGISVGYTDATTIERLQTGDQYIVSLPRHKTMQFELQYLNEDDKFRLFDIARSCGRTTPIFVSGFPESSATLKDKEQMYSIYGRFNTPPNIAHTIFTMYSSSLQLEEF